MDMKRFIPVLAMLVGATGCLSKAPKAPVHWLIEPAALAASEAASPKFGAVRVAQVAVRPPYDGTRLAVLRRDGSVAFDPANSFAAAPGAILRGVVQDVAAASGLFQRVLAPTSGVAADYGLEVTVTRLALDCKVEGACHAVADVSVMLTKGRDVVSAACGSGSMPAGADKNFSAAYSSAVTSALSEALKKL